MKKTNPWLLRGLAAFFGSVFVYAGVLKAADPGKFLLSVRSFDFLPDPYNAWVALFLPWLEIFAGLAVMTGVLRMSGALLLNLALVAFFIALGYAQARGLNVDCGCFGGGSDKTPDYTGLYIRDGLLLVLGGVVMFLEKRRLALPQQSSASF